MTYAWYEAYKTAVLETDWTTMRVRLESAEDAIVQRQRQLSMNHGGTPEERQAIADALSGIKSLSLAEYMRKSDPNFIVVLDTLEKGGH